MSKECRSINDRKLSMHAESPLRISDFGFLSSFGICHSSFTRHVSRFNDSTVQRFNGYHSYRSATIGSTFAALRAGSQQATPAATARISTMPENAQGSVGVSPHRAWFQARFGDRGVLPMLEHAQVVIGIDQKLEVRLHFLKPEVA